MSTLYIDVDDTLVRWLGSGGPHPYGAFAEKWEVNEDVKAYAEGWDGDIVIWSGGGQEYAHEWATLLLPHLEWVAHDKYPAVVGEGDLFIDDMPFDAWAHACIHPDELALQ